MNIFLKKSIIAIAIFNLLDGILTYISIYWGFAYEKNPLMITVMSDPLSVFFIKLLFPTLLLGVIYKSLSEYPVGKLVKIFIIVALLAYIFIMLNHLYVLLQLLIFLS